MKKTVSFLLIVLLIGMFSYLIARENPTQKDIYFYKAISYYTLGDIENAKKNFELYFNIINNDKIKTAYDYLLKNDKITSSKLFEKFVRSRYKRLDALIGYALSVGEYSFYFEEYYFELANEIFSKKSVTYLCYGYFYLREGDLGAAKDLINKAIRLYNLPEYHLLLARYYNYKGSYSLEKDELLKYLPSTKYIKGYLRVAEIYNKNSEPQKAYDFLIKNAENLSGVDEYYILKARTERLLKKSEDAIKTLSKVKNKDSFNFIKEKGILYYKTGNSKKARKLFKKNEFRFEEDKELSYYYGLALLKKNAGIAGRWLMRAGILGKDVKDSILETPRGDEFLTKIENSVNLKFFRIDGIKWINDEVLLVWGKKNTTYKNYLYIIKKSGKIIKSFILDELIQNVSVSHDKTKAAIVSFSKRKDSANLYFLNINTKSLRKINGYDLDEKIWNPVFTKADNRIYFLEENYIKSIYSAPFSIEDNMGKIYHFYPEIILAGYYYNIKTGKFSTINGNVIDNSSKLFYDANMIVKYYKKYSDFESVIERGKTISFSASDRVNLFVKNDYLFVLEGTGTESFIYHLYFHNKEKYTGESSEILKGMPYEYVDFLGISKSKHLLYFKGIDKIIIIDYLKNRKKKIITDLLNVVYNDKVVYYINKSLKVYKLDMKSYKITKPLKLKKYDKILLSKDYLFFINKDLWMYSHGTKREKFNSLFPKVQKKSISPNGSNLSFAKNNILYITPLR